MTEDEMLQDVGSRLRRMPSPEASASQLSRIAARIADGDRVMLETDELAQDQGARRRPFGRHTIAVLACAAVLAGILVVRTGEEPQGIRGQEAAVTDSASGPFGVSALAAQSIRPGSPRIGVLDASQLPTGRWLYASQPIGGSVTADAGRIDTATIYAVVLHGRPVYAITWSWASRFKDGLMADSVWATTRDLTPLRRVFHTRGGSTVTTTFAEDSVTREWSKPDGTVEHMAVAMNDTPEWRRGPTLVGEQEWALFPLLHLRRGWEGHVAMMALANTGELVTLWVDYRVTGEDRITVPAGTFDCWAVRYGSSGDGYPVSDFTRWIDKRTGWLIKEGLTSNRFGREHVLLSYDAGK